MKIESGAMREQTSPKTAHEAGHPAMGQTANPAVAAAGFAFSFLHPASEIAKIPDGVKTYGRRAAPW
jgi:hypothetical protein